MHYRNEWGAGILIVHIIKTLTPHLERHNKQFELVKDMMASGKSTLSPAVNITPQQLYSTPNR